MYGKIDFCLLNINSELIFLVLFRATGNRLGIHGKIYIINE